MAARLKSPWTLVLVYAVLGLAWAMTNAPFSAPDESQHYLRSIGIGNGHLVGARAVYDGPVLSPKETAWRHLLTRAVRVPPGLSPIGQDCELFHPNLTPACAMGVHLNTRTVSEQTDVGIYQPEPYLLPAAVVRLAHHPAAANRDGRLAMLLLWLALLAAAAWSLWDAAIGGLSLIGLVVAVTPMVVFMGASLTDSSLEIIASLAFLAALLRLARPDTRPSAGHWVLAGLTGCVLALSRSLGPVWVVCDLVAVGVLGRPGQARALTRRLALPAAFALLLLAAGIAVNFLWLHVYGPHVSISVIPSVSALHDGEAQLRAAWDGVIGVFGYEDVPLGRFGVVVWTLLGLGLLGIAGTLGSVRERITLIVAVLLGIAVPIYLYAAVTSAEGIQTQGRHILPLLVAVPLLSGEIVRRHAAQLLRPLAQLVFPAAYATAAGVQLLAWWENSRRYAVGLHGSWWFLASPQWSPPGGWVPWVLVVAGVSLGVLGAAVYSIRAEASPTTWGRPAAAEQS